MKGKFEDRVASNEPRRVSRDYAIMLKRVKGTDTELNRFLMLNDFENGKAMPLKLKMMQHEVLPSVETLNLKISY